LTLGYLMFFGATVITPLWLQTQQGYTSEWAGIAVAPNGIIPVLFSVFVGKNLYRFDLRKVVALSFFFFSLSLFYQSSFTTQVDLYTIMFTRFLQGFGVVIFFIPLVQLSLGNIPNEKFASASGLSNFIRILVGSGFGTSLTIYFWSRREIFYYNRIGESITEYNLIIVQVIDQLKQYSFHFTKDVVREVLNQSLEQQSYMLSTNDILWLSAWIFLLMTPLPFFCKKVKKTKGNEPIAVH
jgi:DHA2 family multidrug resistance protein